MTNPSIDAFFRGAFSVDVLLFCFCKGQLKILLEEKEELPHAGKLGFPGRLILPNEDTEEAATSLVEEKTGLNSYWKSPMIAFSDVGRHPLGRVITFPYIGLIRLEEVSEDKGRNLEFHSIANIPELSYDHGLIFEHALTELRNSFLRYPCAFEMLPEQFIIPDLLSLYEQVFDKKIDKRNFRKQLKNNHLIKPLGKYYEGVRKSGRKAELYHFDKSAFKEKTDPHIHFNF